MGRRLVKVQRDHEQGCRIDTVYATARKQFAVVSKVRRVLPSWAGGKEDLWSHPETWDKEFWTVGDRTLKVLRIWMSCERPMVNLQNGSTQRCTSHPMRFWTFNT